MSTIVLRSVKGSPLTNTELDNNFTNLNTDKVEKPSGTSILKANSGSNTLSNAVSGTDYAPATSGSSILKGNGSGGTTAASGTDITSAIGSNAVTNATNASQLGGTAAANYCLVGKQTIWIPATAMVSRTTNGAASGTVETTTNKIMLKTLDFDQTTDEFAQFTIRMPKSWNEGTVTASFVWSSNISGTNSVVWGLQGVAISDDDVIDSAFGTAITVTDAQTAQNDLMQTAESSAITIAGTPVVNDIVVFQVYRDADNGSDTLAGDARLHGVALFYVTDGQNDA